MIAVSLGALAHANALENPFVYDDYMTVVENSTIRDLADVPAIVRGWVFRPLVNLSYAVDYAIWGPTPFGFHLTNVALHLLNVGFVFILAVLIGRDSASHVVADSIAPRLPVVAFAAGALFAVHPMMTEAVGYVSGRSELLCATFVLASFLAFRRWLITRRVGWLIVGLAVWAVALMTKETALVLPIVLVTYDAIVLKRGTAARLSRFHGLLIAVAGLGALLRVARFASSEVPPGHGDISSYAAIQVVAIWKYVSLLLAPLSQSIVHDNAGVSGFADLRAWTGLLGLVLLVLVAVRYRQRIPAATFGVVWFLAFLAPSSSLIPLGEPLAEHRVYVASGGFFIAVVGAAVSLTEGFSAGAARARWLLPGVLVAVLATLSLLTVARNRIWSDPITLWSDAVSKAPATWWSNYHLANALAAADRCPEAIPVYQHAIVLRPERPLTHVSLALCFASLGRVADAEKLLRAVLDVQPALRPEDPRLDRLAAVRRMDGRPGSLVERLLSGVPLGFRTFGELYARTFAQPNDTLRLCESVKQVAPETPRIDECIRTYGEPR